ncbi:uncharacterized protein LOC108671262 [Hyalella azteca]|uniref:Uncharacterized protein LOC108671262 n=1 Tax=Hyalella azteca TaxID=294128 RepID=A0A8B7NKQ8_HYAAZ|nr:uncharacterized protein LOC108671262 [Hyalella azteca]
MWKQLIFVVGTCCLLAGGRVIPEDELRKPREPSNRQGRILPLPIFDNSPAEWPSPFQVDFPVLSVPNPLIPELHGLFPNFPLPFSILLRPIPGISGGSVFNKDTLITLNQAANGNATLGYYLYNPFFNNVPVVDILSGKRR